MPPISLLKQNPHYFEYNGKPTVLVTSGEHYGALMNLDFDYCRYFDTLAADGLNLTRTWSGSYRELDSSFGIVGNTMNPAPGRFICPWPVADGYDPADTAKVKFDLSRWNAAYFERLKDLLTEAAKRNVVVEFTFFCFLYGDELWNASPMRANVNGVGDFADRHRACSLNSGKLLKVQEDLIRKVATELNDFDNLFYEIINEPYSLHDGTAFIPWQKHIVDVLVEAERNLPKKHLIAQNVHNVCMLVDDLHPDVSIVNFHYADPAAALGNYHLGRVIGDDETGFKGQTCNPYRTEAWRFMLSGGGLFNHLDYSFTAATPDGSGQIVGESPSFGGPEMRRQLAVMKRFLDSLPLEHMRPHPEVANMHASTLGLDATTTTLAEHGRVYAVYITGGHKGRIGLGIPAGRYRVEWIRPSDGHVIRTEEIDHKYVYTSQFATPLFAEDIVLRVDAIDHK